MFKKKKDKSRRAPHIHATKEQREAWEWCIKNKINICVVPKWDSFNAWQVEINMKDKITLDPTNYKPTEAMNKMYEYCKYYKNKYENTL
tara:strand:+ start:105 stop:371 length:267 start_codon:yes stop_codon:yes gene_type:complete